jgi:hypothetical protein
MSLYHPIGAPPAPADLEKGRVHAAIVAHLRWVLAARRDRG